MLRRAHHRTHRTAEFGRRLARDARLVVAVMMLGVAAIVWAVISGARSAVPAGIVATAVLGMAILSLRGYAVEVAGRAARQTRRAEVAEMRADGLARQIHDSERIDRALAMCDSGPEVLDTIARFVGHLTDDYPSRLLLTSAKSHSLMWEVSLDQSPYRVLPMARPAVCAAMRELGPLSVADTSQPGACHHLDGEVAMSAACIPLSGVHAQTGIIEVEGPVGDPLDENQLATLGVLGARAGQRLAALGVRLVTEDGDAQDPLTGLFNRDEIMRRVPEVVRRNPVTSIAIADADNWDAISADMGPKAATRAIRLIAATLSDTLRPGDLIARLDGARFVIVLPRCGATDAHRAMDRVRERVTLALADESLPPVTYSIGVAGSEDQHTVELVIGAAERGAEQARADGGNRASIGESR